MGKFVTRILSSMSGSLYTNKVMIGPEAQYRHKCLKHGTAARALKMPAVRVKTLNY